MLSIRLQITSKDQSESQDIELAFDASDIVILDRYLKNHERMLRGRIFEVGFRSVQNIRWTPETGMVFTVSEFDYGHICELLHLARPLFLAREPASFVKAQAVFGKKAKETVLTKHLKYIRDMYERGDYQPYFQITINKTPLFDDETLRAWLNGVEYHQESDKEELVASLGNLFTNRFWLCRSDARTKTAPALGNWARPAGTARGQLPGFAGALRPLQTHLPHTSHQLVPCHPQV